METKKGLYFDGHERPEVGMHHRYEMKSLWN